MRFAIFHRITLSALASTLGGIVRPICLAVFKLITSSNFVGSVIGHELSHFAVQFSGDVLVFEPYLRPRGNLLASQVAAQLEHVAALGILRFALFCAGVKAVFLDACRERSGERPRIPDQE